MLLGSVRFAPQPLPYEHYWFGLFLVDLAGPVGNSGRGGGWAPASITPQLLPSLPSARDLVLLLSQASVARVDVPPSPPSPTSAPAPALAVPVVSTVSRGTEMDEGLTVALVPRDVLEQALQEVRLRVHQ